MWIKVSQKNEKQPQNYVRIFMVILFMYNVSRNENGKIYAPKFLFAPKC